MALSWAPKPALLLGAEAGSKKSFIFFFRDLAAHPKRGTPTTLASFANDEHCVPVLRGGGRELVPIAVALPAADG